MRGEDLLAGQTGLGLQDLPLVLGDPEGGKEIVCKKSFSLCFTLSIVIDFMF